MAGIKERRYGNFGTFKIKPIGNGGHAVFVNDVELLNVKRVKLEIGVGELPTATVEFIVSDIDCEYVDGGVASS